MDVVSYHAVDVTGAESGQSKSNSPNEERARHTGHIVEAGTLIAQSKDGTLNTAAKLVNAISPGVVQKVHRSKNMNIELFQGACIRLGASEDNLVSVATRG